MTNPSSYGVVKLSDYVYFQEGPGIRNSQNTSEGVRFLNIRCFVDGRLDTASMKKVSEIEAYGKYKHFLLDVGDYVVSSSGTLGRIAEVYPEDIPVMLNTSTIRFRPIKNEFLDRLYLRYFLESEVFQQQVKSLATGSVQLNYGPSHLAFVEMPLPPIKSQRAIGKVLDNLTKQISLNHALSKTLEEIAQTIFKSWFIDFDPVKAKMNGEKPIGMDDVTAALFPDSFEESELGLIPKGWNVRTIGDSVIKQKVGKLFDSKTSFSIGTVPVLDQGKSGVVGFHNEQPGVFASPDMPLVVFANHTCTLRLISYPFSVIQNVFPLLGNEVDVLWLYFAIEGKQQFDSYKGHWPDFILHKIIQPSKDSTLAFRKTVEPFLKEKWLLEVQSKLLSDLRDSLLPRLISGELEIPEEMLAS